MNLILPVVKRVGLLILPFLVALVCLITTFGDVRLASKFDWHTGRHLASLQAEESL